MSDENENSWEWVDAEEIKAYIESNGVSGIESFLKGKLDHWKEIEINIAITGVSGSGKSSFINAIRELRDDDAQAAKVDVVECTKEPQCIPHPTNPKIKFWDLPGFGTVKHAHFETYCKTVNFDFYDTYLIFAYDRFTKIDQELAKKVRSLNKNFFFIRTKIDDNLRAAKRMRPFNEEETLKKIRRECSQYLSGFVDSDKEIFLVSNWYPNKWEFERLTQSILDVLPVRQRKSFTLSFSVLTSLSRDILRRKVEVLKARIWKIALASAVGGPIPIPGVSILVDVSLIISEIGFYRSQLGFPDEDSEEFAQMSPAIQRNIRKFIVTNIEQIGDLVHAYDTESAVDKFIRFIPMIGSVIARGPSFGAIYKLLQCCLNDMEKTALKILDELTLSSISDLELE